MNTTGKGNRRVVDEYRIVGYPLVLGSGEKLFSNGVAVARLSICRDRA
ncbi:MAG: hypothetical protein ABIT20_25630 [Gemmatimonadaceae bacterium]